MKGNHSLDEVDRKILDIISHFGTLTSLDLWDEIGEDATLAAQIMSKEEALRRLELLMAQGHVERVKDSERITRWALKEQ
jgi:DNA-binding Lrp family transcriptional regulator